MNPKFLIAGSAPLAARILMGASALLALFLGSGSLFGGAPGCSGAACDEVLAGSYSRVLGIPVAFFGAATYLIVFAAARRLTESRSGALEIAGRVACILTVAFALWFTALQLGPLGGLCALCCVTHLLAVVGVAIVATVAWQSEGGFRPRRFGVAAAGAACFFVAGIAIQRVGDLAGGNDPLVVDSGAGVAKIEASGPVTMVTLYGQQVDLGSLPIIGPRDAENVAVALLDPTCKGCRLVEPMLDGLQSLYGDKLAIVLAPGVRDEESEAIQRTLLGTWHVDPEAYSILLAQLTAGEIKPSRTAVEAAATARLGGNRLKASYEANRAEINRAISFATMLLAKNRSSVGQGALPQLMVGDEIVVGGHSSARYYANVIDRQLGLSSEDHTGQIGAALELAEGSTMHLGELSPGEEHEFEVVVRNAGDAPLEIAWLNLPPGFSVKDSPMGEIAPERGGSIVLTVRAPAEPGPWASSLDIHPRGGGASESLRLMAMVKSAEG